MNGFALGKKDSGVERDIAFTREDFMNIAKYLHDRTGIRLTDANEPMVFSRLASRVRELQCNSFASYLQMAWSAQLPDECEHLISALTTNTTHFFRESYHFDLLRDVILPEIEARARVGERVRIWSAGCSSGEEAYSIALCVLRDFPDVLDYDVRILATDIDREILRRAEAGSYPASSLRNVPSQYVNVGFDSDSELSFFSVNSKLRQLVSFKHLNLIGEWPFSGKFDLIFCRNVAIYMDIDTQEKVWNGFRSVMRRGGYLLIGHSERLSPSIRSCFELVGNTAYRMTTSNPVLSKDRTNSVDRGF